MTQLAKQTGPRPVRALASRPGWRWRWFRRSEPRNQNLPTAAVAALATVHPLELVPNPPEVPLAADPVVPRTGGARVGWLVLTLVGMIWLTTVFIVRLGS
jgi:hypothetical protein